MAKLHQELRDEIQLLQKQLFGDWKCNHDESGPSTAPMSQFEFIEGTTSRSNLTDVELSLSTINMGA